MVILWDDELLTIATATTISVKSLPKLHAPALSNAIPQPLYTYLFLLLLLLSLFLVAPNKHFFFNTKLLFRYIGQLPMSYVIQPLTISVILLFVVQIKRC